MRARSRREPAVLFFDDLHWLDAASRGWLPSLVQAACETRTLLVGTFRPEFEPPWRDLPSAQEMALDTARTEVRRRRCWRSCWERIASLAPLKERIRERAAGNPFFAEQVVLSLAESGQIEGSGAPTGHRDPWSRSPSRRRFRRCCAARIDQLGEDEKRLLQTAAVIGRRFPKAVLEAGGRALER